ncbi:YlbF family regulator [Oikeobacillus pervagus]|nr:YlbF family regulator [Oikeobacillus pervagus]
MEKIAIVEEAEHLAEMILQSDLADQYREHYYKLYQHPVTAKKVRHFVQYKERYEEVQRFGRYHPDYSEVMKNIREVKREMDLDHNVSEFRKIENELQQLLDEISVMIGRSVSIGIKVPTGNPFFEGASSCGGGCGSGGGCSCSA